MKKFLGILLCTTMIMGCASTPKVETSKVSSEVIASNIELYEAPVEPEEVKAPEGTYFSELTGIPIPLEIKDQRPIAVMIDNEILAYPHYGLSEADVVYELVNSLHNGRITRLMALKKDWGSIKQMGSIRSTRDTNIDLQAEWNSILCHDGNPKISTPRFGNPYSSDHISGTFSRVDNGKAREFTEFILPGDLEANINNLNISRDYNDYKPNVDSHFNFAEYEGEEVLDSDEYQVATNLNLSAAYPHNGTMLMYNAETKSYDYYNYGFISVDGEDDKVQSYKNVILQNTIMVNTDGDGGHVAYQIIDSGRSGYYISNGHLQKITWEKKDATDITRYYDEDGNELIINRGNTYIGLIPSESWDGLIIE